MANKNWKKEETEKADRRLLEEKMRKIQSLLEEEGLVVICQPTIIPRDDGSFSLGATWGIGFKPNVVKE